VFSSESELVAAIDRNPCCATGGGRVKILFRATNWVGDAIMALPALRAVRARFSDAEIAIVARPYVADIYRDQQICNQLINYDADGIHAGYSGRERLRTSFVRRNSTLPSCCKTRLTPPGSPGRANIPERIATLAMAAASPHQACACPQTRRIFHRTRSFTTWNFFAV